MTAIIFTILRTLGITAAGWAISDWFNEKQTSQQAAVNPIEVAKRHWVKWIVIGLVTALVTVIFLLIARKLFKNKNI